MVSRSDRIQNVPRFGDDPFPIDGSGFCAEDVVAVMQVDDLLQRIH